MAGLVCLAFFSLVARFAIANSNAESAPHASINSSDELASEDIKAQAAEVASFRSLLSGSPEQFVHLPGKYPLEITPGKPLGTPPSAVGWNNKRRKYLLYVPRSYSWQKPIPLWILAPGTGMSIDGMLTKIDEGMLDIAENNSVAMVVLYGLHTRLSVGRDARSLGPRYPDDVEYTQAVLRVVYQKLSIDNRRIFCVGFSRGARFCSRLASELSSYVSAIATISGIRYPQPNNATRPVPVLAFHGTGDPVNPFNGGGAWYWGLSVQKTALSWAKFNGCVDEKHKRISPIVTLASHSSCSGGADVQLYALSGGGHDWPLRKYLDANRLIVEFFEGHPIQSVCHTAQKGERCYDHVVHAKDKDIDANPATYPGLTSSASFEFIQAALHYWVYADCPRPCTPVASVGDSPSASSKRSIQGGGNVTSARTVLADNVASFLTTQAPSWAGPTHTIAVVTLLVVAGITGILATLKWKAKTQNMSVVQVTQGYITDGRTHLVEAQRRLTGGQSFSVASQNFMTAAGAVVRSLEWIPSKGYSILSRSNDQGAATSEAALPVSANPLLSS